MDCYGYGNIRSKRPPRSIWSVSLKVTLTHGPKMPRKGMPATALPDGGGAA